MHHPTRRRTMAWLAVTATWLPQAHAATGDWRMDRPGLAHRIDPAALPPPFLTGAAGNRPETAEPPDGARPSAPPGFTVQLFATVPDARVLRVAPDGAVFVAASESGRVVILSARDGAAKATRQAVFATGLRQPYGIAFYPPVDPRYVYIAETTRLLRYPWHLGATRPDGPAERVLDHIPTGDHITRDVVVAPGGQRLLLSVGSGSNDADGLGAPPAGFIAAQPTGAIWGSETRRADVLSLDPLGHDVRIYATGLRNCAGEAIEPATGALWCATNERDGLGDDLPPDYLTRVREGGFYGWPWYYIGNHPDPDHAHDRPDLAGRAIVPDILIQPHSAPLGLTFYTGTMFPAEWHGRGFAALHGSWNRATRTGYKVVSFDPATNAYADFLTGFVTDDASVWGRPVDVAVAHDGALLVSEDANGTIWRVAHGGQ